MPRADLGGRTALVTGATGGIGLVTAERLAAIGARVLVHGRTATSAGAACAAICARYASARVTPVAADLSSLNAVRRLAETLASAGPVDLLIHNAGTFTAARHVTADRLERQWAVNAVAPALLTDLMLATDQLTPGARLLFVSSRLHRRGLSRFAPEGLEQAGRYSGLAAYAHSKLAMSLYARALADVLPDAMGIASLHPGVVDTGIYRDLPYGLGPLYRWLMAPFISTPEQGARQSLIMACAAQHPQPRGGYFAHGVAARAHPALADAQARSACVDALRDAMKRG